MIITEIEIWWSKNTTAKEMEIIKDNINMFLSRARAEEQLAFHERTEYVKVD